MGLLVAALLCLFPCPQISAEGLSSGKALPQGLRLLDSRACLGSRPGDFSPSGWQGGYWQGLSRNLLGL